MVRTSISGLAVRDMGRKHGFGKEKTLEVVGCFQDRPGGRGNRKKAGKAARGSQEATGAGQRAEELPLGSDPVSRVR
jgi:hypothetical protein